MRASDAFDQLDEKWCSAYQQPRLSKLRAEQIEVIQRFKTRRLRELAANRGVSHGTIRTTLQADTADVIH